MAEIKTAPVRAQRFEDIDDVDKQPGAFEYFKSGDRYPAGMIYLLPVRLRCAWIAQLSAAPFSVVGLGRQHRGPDFGAVGASRRPLARLAAERHLGERVTEAPARRHKAAGDPGAVNRERNAPPRGKSVE